MYYKSDKQRYRGIVKEFNPEKGIGIIECDQQYYNIDAVCYLNSLY